MAHNTGKRVTDEMRQKVANEEGPSIDRLESIFPYSFLLIRNVKQFMLVIISYYSNHSA